MAVLDFGTAHRLGQLEEILDRMRVHLLTSPSPKPEVLLLWVARALELREEVSRAVLAMQLNLSLELAGRAPDALRRDEKRRVEHFEEGA